MLRDQINSESMDFDPGVGRTRKSYKNGTSLLKSVRVISGSLTDRSRPRARPTRVGDARALAALGAAATDCLWVASTSRRRWLVPICARVSLLAVLIISVNAGQSQIAAASVSEIKRNVLFLYDEPRELPGLRMIDHGLESTLSARLAATLGIYRESLDLSRFPGESDRQLTLDYYRQKYAAKNIQAVVAVMATSLDFMLEYGEEILPGVPVVFCGVDPREIADRKLPPNYTGVLLTRDFHGTAELVVKILPQTRQFYFVGGTSTFDRHLTELARNDLADFEKHFKITYLIDGALADTLDRVSKLPANSVVLYSTVFRDGAGQTFNPYDVVSRVSERANVPVFGFFDQFIGRGLVGGHVYSIHAQGEKAAELTLRILDGEKPEGISVLAGNGGTAGFDWRQLKRWKIPLSNLPVGSAVSFRAPSFWELYRWRVIAISVVLVAQSALILFLIANRRWRQRAESVLRESETRFRNMADTAPIFIWMSGPDKRCTFLNKAWLTFTGRNLDEELGYGWTDGVHPRDLSHCVTTYENAFGERKPFTLQSRFRRHDGVYRTITAEGVPRYDAAGNFLGYLGASVDITNQLDQQRALHEFEERVSLAADAAHLGVWELDTKTLKFWISDKIRELFQFEPGARITYEDFQQRLHPDDRAKRDSAVQQAIETCGDYEMEYRIVLPDGTVRWIAGRGHCTSDGESNCQYRMVGVSMDVTSRKLAEEDAKRNREQVNLLSRASLLGEMTASLAHELNQPLSAIVNNANAGIRFIDDGAVEPSALREILGDVADDGRRAHDIIHNVRNTIKKGNGKRGRINLNDITMAVAHMVQPDAAVHRCEVRTSLAEKLPLVEGDAGQIQQVLVNLVANAFDAMSEVPVGNRKVALVTEWNGDGAIRVIVQDQGIGIPEEAQDRLFEQFFTTKDEGLGMGLAIARSIVEAHGGKMMAENMNGGGARFYFNLPACKTTVTA